MHGAGLNDTIVVVSGLPRSGTSMIMRVLAAGGMPVLTDERRRADAHNPHGYFEFEPAKRLPVDSSWLARARGKAVKVVSPLLRHLPATFRYAVLFVHRDLEQILASQNDMLLAHGETPLPGEHGRLDRAFRRHLTDVGIWLATQPHMEVLHVEHRLLLEDTSTAVAAIDGFLGGRLDVAAAAAAVDRSLGRNPPA